MECTIICKFVASENLQVSMGYSYKTTPSTAHSVIIFTCAAIMKEFTFRITITYRSNVEENSRQILFIMAVTGLFSRPVLRNTLEANALSNCSSKSLRNSE
jgi:hypothetical protein